MGKREKVKEISGKKEGAGEERKKGKDKNEAKRERKWKIKPGGTEEMERNLQYSGKRHIYVEERKVERREIKLCFKKAFSTFF